MGAITLVNQSTITVTSTGVSTTNGSVATASSALDARSLGTANLANQLALIAELACQFASTGGTAAQETAIADLYLVPSADATNFQQIDSTSGAASIPAKFYAGTFSISGVWAATTTYYMQIPKIDIEPAKYTAYIINRSGVTINVNWSLIFAPYDGGY